MKLQGIQKMHPNQFCINLDLECARNIQEEEEEENSDTGKTAPDKCD